jgi:DNA-directed RNA polymerase specialized sigma24 family protein
MPEKSIILSNAELAQEIRESVASGQVSDRLAAEILRRARHVACRLCGDEFDIVDDAAQETFIRVALRIKEIHTNPRAYIERAAKSVVTNMIVKMETYRKYCNKYKEVCDERNGAGEKKETGFVS